MTRTVGIIPAGGQAGRFNGVMKELLPISQEECGLTRTIATMQAGGANEVWIVTNREKITAHWHAAGQIPGVHFKSHECKGVWEAIALCADVPADWYYFAMPDTIYPAEAFVREPKFPVTAGTFYTDKPERYGMLRRNLIVDKEPGLPGNAWGVWMWSFDAFQTLTAALGQLQDHTKALNVLISRYGVETFSMGFYYDFATFADYREYLCTLI